jgi:hypothetical protein
VDQVVSTTAKYNCGTGSFVLPGRTSAVFVRYEPARVRISHLMEDVQALVDAGVLNKGLGRSLLAKLANADKQLEASHSKTATNVLKSFVNETTSLITEGKLTADQGQPLIDLANDNSWQIDNSMDTACQVQ